MHECGEFGTSAIACSIAAYPLFQLCRKPLHAGRWLNAWLPTTVALSRWTQRARSTSTVPSSRLPAGLAAHSEQLLLF
jgi:hypothetical protein